MAGGVSVYASINAKVRIKYSQLLGADELAILGEADDLASLLEALKQTAYGPDLESLRDAGPAKGDVVTALLGHLAATYQEITQVAPGPARRVLLQLYRRHELNNLKAVLRGIATGGGEGGPDDRKTRTRSLLFPYGPGTVLPAERMLEAGTIGSAVELLAGTQYFDVLTFAMKRYNAEQSLFPLEVALDIHYWRRLWQEALNLQGLDQRQAMRVIGSLLDMNNLMWAIRYRVYQHLSEEELINYTLPFGYRLRDEDIRAVAAGSDIGTVVSRLFPNIPDVATLLAEPGAGLPLLEVRLKRHVMRECEAAFLGDPFHVGIPLALLILCDFEVQDLILYVEAKDSRLPATSYEAYVAKTPVVNA